MQFVVWVETIIAGKSVAVQRAAVVERQCLADVPTKLGLSLQEGRSILTGCQDVVQTWGYGHQIGSAIAGAVRLNMGYCSRNNASSRRSKTAQRT